MLAVLLVIQVILASFLVTIILLQRSQSDGLAGLGGGNPNSVLSGRASANLLTKTTTMLAIAFMTNSLAMATITARQKGFTDQVLEQPEAAKEAPAVPTPAENTPPAVPTQ